MLEVGAVSDFEEGKFRFIDHNGRSVGVVLWKGAFYALNNNCPHQGAPVCLGHLGPKVRGGTKGEIDADSGAPVLACAWHGWEFDLATGGAVWDQNYRVKTYETVVQENTVYLNVRVRKDQSGSS